MSLLNRFLVVVSMSALAMGTGGCGDGGQSTTPRVDDEPPDGEEFAWRALDPLGLQDVTEITSMAEYDGELYVGGIFGQAGESQVDMIAAWDGSLWNPLPRTWRPAENYASYLRGVRSLIVHDGTLFLAGGFRSASASTGDMGALRWDGTRFAELHRGWGYGGATFAIWDGALFIGCMVGDPGCRQPTPSCDESCHQGLLRFYTTTFGFPYSWFRGVYPLRGEPLPVRSLATFQNSLIIAGNVNTIYECTGTPRTLTRASASKLAAWDGRTWTGFVGPADVNDMILFDGELVFGGGFTDAAGMPANRIASWDGGAWTTLGEGLNDEVHDLLVYDGDLIAAGAFTSAGGAPARRIARWDGTTWHALGSGMTGEAVTALGVYKGDLIAAGIFSGAGGVPVNNIARWSTTP